MEHRRQFLMKPDDLQKAILTNMSPDRLTNHFAFEHIINLTLEEESLKEEGERQKRLRDFETDALRKARANKAAERMGGSHQRQLLILKCWQKQCRRESKSCWNR